MCLFSKSIKMRCYFIIISLLFTLSSCNLIRIMDHGKSVEIVLPPDSKTGRAMKINLGIFSPEIIRVSVSEDDSALNSPGIIAAWEPDERTRYTVRKNREEIKLITDSLLVSVELSTGNISFYDHTYRLILSESGRSLIAGYDDVKGDHHEITQYFGWQEDEAHFGLGQHEHGSLNLRGRVIELYQENTKVSVPFLLSTRGYGLLWDNYSRSVYNDMDDSSLFYSENGDKIQYYFIKGDNFDRIISGYRQLTGEAPLYPRWALGYMQSRNRYRSQAELLSVVEKQRRLNIPMDVIILDYYHWGDKGFGSFVFDENDFPKPVKMIEELHNKYNCKLLVSVWPSFTPETKNWELFNRNDYLLDVMVSFNSQLYDAFNPDAGKLYYDLLKESYLDSGVDGWWFDATEPENLRRFHLSHCYLGPSSKYLNLYSYFGMKNIYENQIRDTGKRIYILTRSAFAGQQKFGTTVWSGDIHSTFEELKVQIPAGLNFCMSGIPYWTTDIGGYRGGNAADPAYREVFTRWFQYGTFCPVFRAHGRRYPSDRTGVNEIWSYGPEKQEILTSFINLRYRLMPYIYSLSARVTNEGYTIMRGLPFDFPEDTIVYDITDQFMFGEEFLVCPVTDPGVEYRRVYLPEGCQWYDFWTGQRYEGGQYLDAYSPIHLIPLFVKAGSVVAMGTVMQYADEKFPDPLEVRIYQGKDGKFILYEDENDNFNYLKGAFRHTPFIYNDSEKTFKIGPATGTYMGCPAERIIQVVIVGDSHGVGVEEEKNAGKTVVFTGKEMVMKISPESNELEIRKINVELNKR